MSMNPKEEIGHNVPESTPINRLILVGNGFDLAHDMKTKYEHFILGYFQNCLKEAINKFEPSLETGSQICYRDELILISINSLAQKETLLQITTNNFTDLKKLIKIEDPIIHNKTVSIKISSTFFSSIVNKLFHMKWVDIENYYYEELIKILSPTKNTYNPRGEIKVENLLKLNNDFDKIKHALEKYLSSIDGPKEVEGLSHLIYEEAISDMTKPEKKYELKNVMILNFNYTETTQRYLNHNADLVHIHGELSNENNPIIFGYGDERDETYEKLEKAKVEGVFTHIKSFDYFKTDNYSRLLAFLESEFDVYIMGHSCGLSDRTLLSTIFEHEKCRFIKIFYYKDESEYRKTTYEVSRHFTDKALMRKRVLDFTKCVALPQSNNS